MRSRDLAETVQPRGPEPKSVPVNFARWEKCKRWTSDEERCGKFVAEVLVAMLLPDEFTLEFVLRFWGHCVAETDDGFFGGGDVFNWHGGCDC